MTPVETQRRNRAPSQLPGARSPARASNKALLPAHSAPPALPAAPPATVPSALPHVLPPESTKADEILRAVEAERQRLAADLHDDVGQLLTGLTCLGTALADRLRGRDDLAAEDARTIAEIGREALEQVRALTRELTGRQITQRGLAHALEELCARATRLHAVAARLDWPAAGVNFGEETARHVLRIAQEAIANATRHGHASRIDIALSRHGDAYRLTIADNGCGFDRQSAPTSNGSGLSLMERRAELIGGRLAIQSSLAEGTRIEVLFTPRDTYPHENAC